MLFNSFPFLVFFTAVAALYFLLPHRFRWALLLFASCFFYMFFKPVYILILAFTIVIDYYAGILIENAPDKKRKKRFLIASLIANIGVLAIFKYYNFINTNITGVALQFGLKTPSPFLKIALPIGLSFHTFQSMSYTIEVYRGHQKAERHFGIYALYVMFYPQLVAGPIERPQQLLPQFREHKYFNYNNTVAGLRLMVWGLFKKAVIADRLGAVVDPIFNYPLHYTPISILVAAVFFTFQLYCDFSGYSDIAIGSAKVMGFDLMQNFNRPFSSKSIAEFWRRWNMSLSSWFRDYLYIPLGGNRVSTLRKNINILFVFIISGLWHGAGWTYIAWGALHGAYMVIGNATTTIRNKLRKLTGITKITWLDSGLQTLVTFTLVVIAFVFFRASTVKKGWYMISNLPLACTDAVSIMQGHTQARFPVSDYALFLCFLVIAILIAVQAIQKKRSIVTLLQNQPRYLRWGIYYAVILAIIYLGIFNNRHFIYFQF